MNSEVRVVFVEDVPDEAVMVEQALQKGGLACRVRRVESREDFLNELELRPPHVILSDHGLPAFDGLAALKLARERCPGVPFIFVTNALTRDMEIEKLSPGAAEFVCKSQLHLLAPVVRRVLGKGDAASAGMKKEKREQLEAALRVLLAEYERAGGFLPICSSCKKIRDWNNTWHSPETFFRKYAGLKFTHGICPDCVREFSPQGHPDQP